MCNISDNTYLAITHPRRSIKVHLDNQTQRNLRTKDLFARRRSWRKNRHPDRSILHINETDRNADKVKQSTRQQVWQTLDRGSRNDSNDKKRHPERLTIRQMDMETQ